MFSDLFLAWLHYMNSAAVFAWSAIYRIAFWESRAWLIGNIKINYSRNKSKYNRAACIIKLHKMHLENVEKFTDWNWRERRKCIDRLIELSSDSHGNLSFFSGFSVWFYANWTIYFSAFDHKSVRNFLRSTKLDNNPTAKEDFFLFPSF